MMILPLIFLAFLYVEPTLSIANNSLIFGYSIKGEGESTKYQGNLHHLLGSLSSQTSINRFSNFTTSLTKTPNQLHGVYLCRGDIDPQACQSCINSARKFILSHYRGGREAAVWYNHCMIRYSNESFLGKFDETMCSASSDNKRVKGNYVQFMNIVRRTLKGLATQASNRHNGNKFASTDVKLAMDDALSLQAMVQCTPDLVATDCYRCLMYASQKILRTAYGSKSARVLYKNCFVQYKTIHAINDDMVESLPILPSPATNNSTLFQLRVQLIPFSNNSDANWPINSPKKICFKVRFGIPPFSNNTVNSSPTSPSWAITNSSSSSPTWKFELKELLNQDDVDSNERSKEWVTA